MKGKNRRFDRRLQNVNPIVVLPVSPYVAPLSFLRRDQSLLCCPMLISYRFRFPPLLSTCRDLSLPVELTAGKKGETLLHGDRLCLLALRAGAGRPPREATRRLEVLELAAKHSESFCRLIPCLSHHRPYPRGSNVAEKRLYVAGGGYNGT
jgi:hypothetical protein